MLDRRFFRTISLLLVCLSLSGTAGCSTIRSTLYSDDLCQTCNKTTKHLKGIPTTLEVPTHLHVYVYRTRWGTISDDTGAVTFLPELEAKSVGIDPIVQKEIFTVDFKRPASGNLAYDIKLDSKKQYIYKVDNSLEDKTITSVANLVSQILKTVPTVVGGKSSGVTPLNSEGGKLVPFQDVIATEVFALNEPKMQERIQEFLDVYLNRCDRQCGPCPYPGPPPACIPGHGCKMIRLP